MAFAINSIFDPLGLVTGGFTGIAIIVKSLTSLVVEGGVPLGVTNIVLNIPLFIAGIKIKGYRFIKRTLFATVMLSVALSVVPADLFPTEDLILASLFGGVITGIGIGFIFLAYATTGGTDMLAALIQKYVRHYSIAQILQVIDAIIVIAGAYIFGIRRAMYAVIVVVVVSWVTDNMIDGLKFSKLAYIISDEYEKIAKEISDNLDRGTTALNGTGMYTMQERKVLICVVSKKEIIHVREIVHKIDSQAFLIVTDVREVFGEGFIEYKQ